MFAWIDSWTYRRRERLAAVMLAIVVGSVIMAIAGSAVGAAGTDGGLLLWTGLTVGGATVAVSGLLVWRQQVHRRGGQRRLHGLDAQKRALVARILTKEGGQAALANVGVCRHCGWFATHTWEPSPAAVEAVQAALLVHESECVHQPGRTP